MSVKHISIAIDGPSGAGKSSIARRTAAAFGFLYVDTGAIYRTVGLAVYRAGIASRDIEGIVKMLPTLDIALRYAPDGEQHMYLAGEDVSALIRTPEISIYASDVSAFPEVRAYLSGQTLPCDCRSWTLVTTGGLSLGWGKAVGDMIKNHYPRGLRKIL